MFFSQRPNAPTPQRPRQSPVTKRRLRLRPFLRHRLRPRHQRRHLPELRLGAAEPPKRQAHRAWRKRPPKNGRPKRSVSPPKRARRGACQKATPTKGNPRKRTGPSQVAIAGFSHCCDPVFGVQCIEKDRGNLDKGAAKNSELSPPPK